MTDVKDPNVGSAPTATPGAISAAEAEGRIRRVRRTKLVDAPAVEAGSDLGATANVADQGSSGSEASGAEAVAPEPPQGAAVAQGTGARGTGAVGQPAAAAAAAAGARPGFGGGAAPRREGGHGGPRGAGFGGERRGPRGAGFGGERRDRGDRGFGGGGDTARGYGGDSRRQGGGRHDAGGAGAPRSGAVLARTQRTVYRQDIGEPLPARPAVPVPSASGPAARPTQPDKLTLILHPAPKAARGTALREDKPLTAKEALKAKHQKSGAAKVAAPRPEADKAPASAALEPAWLAASADGAVAAATAAGSAADALVQAWLDAGNAHALVALAAVDSAPGRKAARRALSVLRTRGVALPEVAAPVPAAQPAAADDEVTASYIPPDESGTSFFTFCQRLPGGSFRVADIMVSSAAGVVHASSGTLAGKHIRSWRGRVQERFGMPPVVVPLDWARFAIAEGRRRNDETKQIVPLGFDRCAPLLVPVPEGIPAHPAAALDAESFDAAELERAVLDSEQLHAEPEFRRWLPERRALDELFAKVTARLQAAAPEGADAGSAGGGPNVESLLAEEIDAATDRYFSPEMRAIVASQLRDAAISLRVRRGDEAARGLLALRSAVVNAGLITQPPRAIPFLVAYFKKGVALMARARGA